MAGSISAAAAVAAAAVEAMTTARLDRSGMVFGISLSPMMAVVAARRC
ncbi:MULTISPECIES: hypothetical protein [unclassified Sphingomonas]|nr:MULTISPECIES: hypothetical protein [unclassified Sphingomonas]